MPLFAMMNPDQLDAIEHYCSAQTEQARMAAIRELIQFKVLSASDGEYMLKREASRFAARMYAL